MTTELAAKHLSRSGGEIATCVHGSRKGQPPLRSGGFVRLLRLCMTGDKPQDHWAQIPLLLITEQ